MNQEEEKGSTLDEIQIPLHLTLALAVFVLLLLWLLLPTLLTHALLSASVLATLLITAYLSFRDLKDHLQDYWNILPSLLSLGVLTALIQGASPLLVLLFVSYLLLSLLLAGKILKLQTVLILSIALTAILFRVYPVLPGTSQMAGHLISMDDPYYHYKYTNLLYTLGDLPDRDYTVYPPMGKSVPHSYVYYQNTYLALLSGQPIHHIVLLYPVFISAFASVFFYFLIKELTGDWKSGFLGGILFATLPAILSKSLAGGVEEDIMGLSLSVFSIYLLIKAARTSGRRNLLYSVLTAVFYLAAAMTWKGTTIFFTIPYVAFSVYLLFASTFKKDTWEITKAISVSGLTFLLLKFFVDGMHTIDFTYSPSFLLAFLIALWSESTRERLGRRTSLYASTIALIALVSLIYSAIINPTESSNILLFSAILLFAVLFITLLPLLPQNIRSLNLRGPLSDLEKRLHASLPTILACVMLLIIVAAFFVGIDRVMSRPEHAFSRIAGTSVKNFLVDKTIQEQATMYGWGPLYKAYNVSLVMTLIMLVLLPAILIIYLYFKRTDAFLKIFKGYALGLLFFLLAWNLAQQESRLGFSQSLGFLTLASMAGLILPKNTKEIATLKILPLILVVVFIPAALFVPHFPPGQHSAWENIRGPSADPAWFYGVQWLASHINPGHYEGNTFISGDYVLTWWDYGHFITALSPSTVIADPTQANEEYIMRIARFFYNTTSEEDALRWLMTQPWNPKDSNGNYRVKYIILDYSLVGKSSALAFLGTNYYEYPNGYTAINGTCEVGQVCQNVENGLEARVEDGRYVCDQGVVCKRDLMTNVKPKKCCEESPSLCCNMTLNGKLKKPNLTAAVIRRPGEPVYDVYQLLVGRYVCKPSYTTSLSPAIVVENGEKKTITRRYLYVGYGLPYSNGGVYPAFILYTYSDGTQALKFISRNCDLVDYKDVISHNDLLLNVGYATRLQKDVLAPQIFIHVPKRWLHNMFTELYLLDAKNLKHFSLVIDDTTKRIYPSVKIFKITYPDNIPSEDAGLNKSNGAAANQTIPGATQTQNQSQETNQTPLNQSTLNMTYDYYSPELGDAYEVSYFPTIVWNCEMKKTGKLSDINLEQDTLKRITCIMNKAVPEDLCKNLGVSYDPETKKIKLDPSLSDILNVIKKTSTDPCPPADNTTLLQVFYSPRCAESCEIETDLLNNLKADFGDLVNITYYCLGNATYCTENSLKQT